MATSLKDAMDAALIGRLQWIIAVMLTAVLVFDGLDLLLAAFSAPLLMKEWGLSKPQFGPLLAAALIGMAFGSLIGSWSGDRWGRRPTLVASVVFFGSMTIVCAGAQTPSAFIALRFLSGLGFGAALPVAMTLMGEWMPPRASGKAISIMTLGIPVGITLGASIASYVLPMFGWQWLFVAVGVACLLFAAFMWRALPESPPYLLLRKRDKDAHALLSRAWSRPVDGPAGTFRLEPKRESGESLLVRGNSRVNAGLWLGVLFVSCISYGMSGWITVVLTGLQLLLPTALRGSSTFSLSAVSGALVIGWVLARLGSQLTMLILCLIAVVAASCMAWAADVWPVGPDLFAVLFGGLAFVGFCTGALQAVIYALAASAYDTPIRVRGMGVTSMMSRVGAITTSFAGGAVLAWAHEAGFFALMAAMAAGGAVTALVLNRHMQKIRSPSWTERSPVAAQPAGKEA